MSPRARVTGFGAFGAVVDNPSGEVARALAVRLTALGWDASAETLEVTFDAARSAPRRLLGRADDAWLVHVGVAEARRVITLERTAKNRAGARADVAGLVSPAILDVGGPPVRVTTVAVDAVAAALRVPVDVELGDDAGDFVCNALYYESLRATSMARHARSLFVHVPLMDRGVAGTVGRALAEAMVGVA